jgi:hypothetical protein
MAISYIIVFFLCELVRYYPDRLDDVAETNAGWLIESFVKSAPTLMLRLMLNAVLRRNFLIRRL